MNRANDIWRLVRDILFALAGLGLLYLLALGKVPPSVAPSLVPIAAGLCGLPVFLRSDERKRRKKK